MGIENAKSQSNISSFVKPELSLPNTNATRPSSLVGSGSSGSGTTAIACTNLNRNFICCELEKEYYDKSIERLEKQKKNLKQFLF